MRHPRTRVMKSNPLFPVLGIAFLGWWAGCSTSPVSRIDQNRERYDSWPLEVKEAVLQGEARPGMTREQVEMALGKPTEIITRSTSGGGDETWVYRPGGVGTTLARAASAANVGTSIGGVSVGATGGGISVGSGVGGVSVGTTVGGSRSRQPAGDREIVFADGVVLRADPGP
jgi:hypothetical protein